MIRKFLAAVTLFIIGATSMTAQNKEQIKQGTILHCWCWSFKTIEENIELISRAGFTAIQTSPANECFKGDNGGLEIMSRNSGKWYYHYQPTDWKIGNYQLGTRDDFIRMCAKAKSYNISVIVDVVPNHTTTHKDAISQDFIKAVGGMEKMYHANSDHTIRSMSNRREVTSAMLGGLPDVNTENPLFQEYFLNYVNDLIKCGADGFRFDTAKHIALPDDPVDSTAAENDFWPVFTGKKSVNGKSLANAENIFLYGEVLQEGASREDAYGKFFPVTASNYGKLLRSALKNGKLNAKGIRNFQNAAAPEVVTWIESHDTYANEGESSALSNFLLRAGWAVITSRKEGTPLFFSRPKGKEATQFPGQSKIGESGNSEFFSPEVSEVNKFRTAMAGENEEFINGENSGVLIIKRGEKGCVIINLNSKPSTVELRINLKNGTYIDKANKIKFKCKNSVLTGKIKPQSICVVY
ncbi:alpha-amylase family glycosyl hydrolase [Treponema sp.]|uniref:alpha-amylase family glycosyl hydrolase n=1 Tax=Treponema sp. TaxID=166 RepID=UPI003F065E58